MSPREVSNLTDNYIYFSGCSYYDEDGDLVDAGQEYSSFIVRRSDGLVYSTYGMSVDGGWSAINSSFVEEPSGSLLASFYTFSVDNPGFVGRITLSHNEGLWQQLSSDNSPIRYADYPKVFLMKGGVVATSYFAEPLNTYWVTNNLLPGFDGVGIIYPNGGYDVFSTGKYAVLDEGLLDLGNFRYISIGNSYGQSTVEPVGVFNEEELFLSSWYETDDKVILKSLSPSHNRCPYLIYDKLTKQFSRLETGFEGEDNMELWKDNLCNGRFYGLMRQNGKLTKVVWLDPLTCTTGQIAIPLADEIDITYWGTDYSTGKAQVSGTRRSDGYNVAVSIDLQTGKYDVLFSDPHRKIVSLIPLH